MIQFSTSNIKQTLQLLSTELFGEVYACQFKLAKYFQGTGDKWLSDHFFDLCLETSTNVKSDGGKMAAQAHCNVGMALEESGKWGSF